MNITYSMRKSFITFLFLLCISNFAILAYSDDASAGSKLPQTSDKDYLNTINKLVDESRNDLKHAERQRREDMAKSFYQKGLDLTEQGKFGEAREYFERAIRMTEKEDMASHIKEGEERLRIQEEALKKAHNELTAEKKNDQALQEEQKKKQELILKRTQQEAQKRQEIEKRKEHQKEVNSSYQHAVSLYKQKKYTEAQSAFNDLEKNEPDYKATHKYLNLISERITREEALKEKKQKDDLARQEREARQAKIKEEQLKQKEALRKELETKNKNIEEQKKSDQEKEKMLEEKRQQEEQQRKAQEQKLIDQRKQEEETKKKEQEQKAQEQEKQKLLDQQKQQDDQKKSEELEKQKQKDDEALKQKNQKEEEENQKKEAQLAKDREEQAKREAFLQKQNSAREKIRQQADEDYRTALDFYREHKFKESKDKFEAVRQQWPGYKSTDAYIRKLDKIIVAEQRRQDDERQKAFEKQKREDDRAKRIQEAHQRWVENQKVKDVSAPTQDKPKTEVASSTGPSSSTSSPKEPVSPPVTLATTKEQQEKEAQLLASLAERSSRLYRQISDMADDKNTVIAKNKMAKVDQVFNNLKQEKEKTLIQIHEEEQRRYEQELKDKQRMRQQEAQKAYDEAIDLLGSKDFDGAKRKFLEVENIQPNYKSTRNYLSHIYEDQRRVMEEAIAEKAREKQRRFEEEQAQKRILEAQQRQERISQLEKQLVEISRSASSINDDILKLTAAKDYMGAKAKFDDLEGVMGELKKVKERLATEREDDRLAKAQAKEKEMSNQEAQRVLREKNLEAIHYKNESIHKERQRQDAHEVQAYKEKEEINQRNVIFHQAIDFYRAKKYREAKIIFEELQAKGDNRARAYLKKIDRIEEKDLTKISKSVDQKRSEYLERRLHQQRLESLLDNQDQKRQRKLSLELEKQKQALEAERQEERRRIETLKIQEKQRQRLEKERQKVEAQRKKQEEQYHFRKVEPASKSLPKPKPQQSEKMMFSKAGKKEEDKQKDIKKIPEPENENLEKKKAEERELQNQKKKEQDKIAQEAKEKLEAEQAKERLEKENAQKKVHEQEQKKIELEKSVKERQDKLEMERKAIREQLESGVDAMYTDAIKLYKSGHYNEAAKRFTDVQDLIPNYKKSSVYLKKAQSRLPKTALPSPSQVTKKESSVDSKQPQQSTDTSRKDEIVKTLDLFDSK